MQIEQNDISITLLSLGMPLQIAGDMMPGCCCRTQRCAN